MRLIDAEHLKWNVGGIKCGTLTVAYLNWILEHEEPTVDAIPISWIKEWVEEIKDHPAYTEKEKTLCIEEFEDMLGAWAERKEE